VDLVDDLDTLAQLGLDLVDLLLLREVAAAGVGGARVNNAAFARRVGGTRQAVFARLARLVWAGLLLEYNGRHAIQTDPTLWRPKGRARKLAASVSARLTPVSATLTDVSARLTPDVSARLTEAGDVSARLTPVSARLTSDVNVALTPAESVSARLTPDVSARLTSDGDVSARLTPDVNLTLTPVSARLTPVSATLTPAEPANCRNGHDGNGVASIPSHAHASARDARQSQSLKTSCLSDERESRDSLSQDGRTRQFAHASARDAHATGEPDPAGATTGCQVVESARARLTPARIIVLDRLIGLAHELWPSGEGKVDVPEWVELVLLDLVEGRKVTDWEAFEEALIAAARAASRKGETITWPDRWIMRFYGEAHQKAHARSPAITSPAQASSSSLLKTPYADRLEEYRNHKRHCEIKKKPERIPYYAEGLGIRPEDR
jgi:hypothetical protein